MKLKKKLSYHEFNYWLNERAALVFTKKDRMSLYNLYLFLWNWISSNPLLNILFTLIVWSYVIVNLCKYIFKELISLNDSNILIIMIIILTIAYIFFIVYIFNLKHINDCLKHYVDRNKKK